jgi:NADH:quinone reductase (non-electrogenic)
MRALRNTERVLNNANVDRLLQTERERDPSDLGYDIHDQVAGVYSRIMSGGDMDAGAWSCGMVVGLIHDIPSVAELLMADAEQLIRDRLVGLLGGDEPAEMRESVASVAWS